MTRHSILIVDDDYDLLLGLGIRLRSAGYKVLVAGDAIQAVSVAVRKRPDLILLDLGLPAGDGMTVLTRLRHMPELALIPVIIITARDASFEAASSAAGAVGFFQKPVDNDELLTAITAALDVHHDASAE